MRHCVQNDKKLRNMRSLPENILSLVMLWGMNYLWAEQPLLIYDSHSVSAYAEIITCLTSDKV
jgi:hypothetical protein